MQIPIHTHTHTHLSTHQTCVGVQNKLSYTHAHKHTAWCVDGWATRAQFGPDILGQYNTQLLSLITLARTIKPQSAIAHSSQGENLFSLLHRHLTPSWGHGPVRLYWGLNRGPYCVVLTLVQSTRGEARVEERGLSTMLKV